MSCKIVNPRTCNSYVQLKNKKFIKILYFTHDSKIENNCVGYEINVIEHDLCSSLFICTKINKKTITFDINLIDNLCVFMEIDGCNLIRPCPNKLQY